MTKLRRVFLILNLFLVIGLIFLINLRGPLSKGHSQTSLPSHGEVAGFTLTEKTGAPFTLQDLRGKVWVADFIFTRCGGQCPVMSRKMRQFQDELPRLTLVSFSVDPDTDTPEVLSRYAENYGADPARWLFLTGDKDALNLAARSFHVTGLGEPMFHSVSFALVDPKGQIRGYYDSEDADKIKQFYRDVRLLLRQ